MKSRVTQASPVMDNGQLRTYDGNYGKMYFTSLVFENGDQGEYMHKTNPQTKFNPGQEAEYTNEPNQNPQFPNKIKPVSTGDFNNKSGSNQSIKGYALRYAVDVWIAKLASGNSAYTKEQVLKLADYFHDYMEAKPVAPVQTLAPNPEAAAITTPVHEAFVPDAKPELDSLPF